LNPTFIFYKVLFWLFVISTRFAAPLIMPSTYEEKEMDDAKGMFLAIIHFLILYKPLVSYQFHYFWTYRYDFENMEAHMDVTYMLTSV
jgi:hypothetical protein